MNVSVQLEFEIITTILQKFSYTSNYLGTNTGVVKRVVLIVMCRREATCLDETVRRRCFIKIYITDIDLLEFESR